MKSDALHRPFDTSKAQELINGFTATMTTVVPSNVNVMNIAKVCANLTYQSSCEALKLRHAQARGY